MKDPLVILNFVLFHSVEPNPPIDDVIQAGVIPRFVGFLQRVDDNVLQV